MAAATAAMIATYGAATATAAVAAVIAAETAAVVPVIEAAARIQVLYLSQSTEATSLSLLRYPGHG